MFFILLLLFIAVPAAEIWLLIAVGSSIGVFQTIMIVLLTGVTGAYLAKMEGLAVIRDIQSALSEGRIPGNEMISGLLVFAGGLLLLTPGFITDIAGILMIFPPIRMLVAVYLKKYFEKKIRTGAASFSFYSNIGRGRSKKNDPNVIDADDYKDN